ncbi:MAG: ATP-binding cassette domain-containing protein [Candidatus Omnitrophota bacterium]|nr:ATP-binding cassette domain-containing protein [Candidatus Omnitrophota bacterium]
MAMTVFELKDVHFSYLGKFPALAGIDITVEEGRNIAVIGANGSGKSTLLHLLNALIFADKGSCKFFGRELNEGLFREEDFSKAFRRAVGLVFQNPDVQLFCPTVREEIMFGPLHLGFDPKTILPMFDSITKVFGIEGLVDRMPHQLSIGEKRKVAMASVLISGPDILLLDEPTSGLDPKTSRDLIDLLKKHHESGKTTITATHDLHIIEEIADIIYVFDKNKTIIRYGDPHELLCDIKFLEENNLMHSHSHRHDGETHVHRHDHLMHDHAHS